MEEQGINQYFQDFPSRNQLSFTKHFQNLPIFLVERLAIHAKEESTKQIIWKDLVFWRRQHQKPEKWAYLKIWDTQIPLHASDEF